MEKLFCVWASNITTLTMDRGLKEAAEAGDIDALYNLLRQDAYLLERVDQIPFVDTPLHIAASSGHIEFAMEIMNLKASFARKLDQDGLSPMHLALKNNHKLMVLLLADADSGLIRVKGRKGMTPLHFAAESGNSSVLAEFCEACPESIKDVTNQGDTALHLAVEHHQMEALQVLLGWLKRSAFDNAEFWVNEILNWRNQQGNNVLHIAALTRQRQAVKTLLKIIGVMLNIRNSEGLTAIDILQSQRLFNDSEIKRFRSTQRCRESFFWNKFPSSDTENNVKKLASRMSFRETFKISFIRVWTVSSDRRNALLVVDALIATITYQATLSPPGGVWQGTADINSPIRNNIMHINNTTNTSLSELEASAQRYVGTTVMGSDAFTLFWLANTFVFCVATVHMYGTGISAFPPIIFLLFSCYTCSMSVISPTKDWSKLNLYFSYGLMLATLLHLLFRARGQIYEQSGRGRSRRRLPMSDREEWWQ